MAESDLSLRADAAADALGDPVEQSVGGPSWSWGVEIVGPDEEAHLTVGVQCRNVPVGSKYQFTIPAGVTKDGRDWPGVDSGLRPVMQPDEAFGFFTTWPAGVVTDMTISWWAEGTAPPQGASIEAMLGISEFAAEGELEGPLEERADLKDKVVFRFE